jgi:hypothetical protein
VHGITLVRAPTVAEALRAAGLWKAR